MGENLVSSEKAFKFMNELNLNNVKNNLKLSFFSNYILNYVFERPIGIYGTVRGPMPYFIYDQADVLFLGSDFSFKRKYWISEKKALHGKFTERFRFASISFQRRFPV